MEKRLLLSTLIRRVVFCVIVLVFCVAVVGFVFISIKVLHSCLIHAARDGDTKRVKYLLAWGVDVNGQGLNGETAMLEACAGRQTSTASILLAHGADPNRALWYAIDTDNIVFVKLLIAAGAVVKSDVDVDTRSHGNAAIYHVVHAAFLRQQKPGVKAHNAPP